jgi:uncharacterized RDD family membrane protein YckC
MSDVSQGAGWWMASDGKWYPPHLHPSVINLPPPPPAYGGAAQTQPNPQAPGYGVPGPDPSQWAPSQGGGPPPWSNSPSQPAYPPGYGPPPGMAPTAPLAYADPRIRVDSVLNLPLAPWWKRLVAVIIDGLVLVVPYFIILVIIGAATSSSTNSNVDTQPTPAGAVAVGIIIAVLLVTSPFILYFGIMNGSRRGQTLGKMALGIAVRDARGGQAIGFWRAVGRYVITIVFELLLFVPFILDSVSPLWDERNQAWHDRVAHSVVVDLGP